MKVIDIVWEDFVNYKVPCMTIQMPYCSFKCDKEYGCTICQNSELAHAELHDWKIKSILAAYKANPVARAICFQGLEPFDSFTDLLRFIAICRQSYFINDDIVIYTGYNKDEIEDQLTQLKQFPNIIVKFGRYIPECEAHFDEVLGVKLASPNQYAERIS